MRRTITLAIALLVLFAMAVPAFAGGNGKAGESDTYHCYFTVLEDGGYEGDAWGKIMVREFDGMLAFVVNFHGLDPGSEIELKSGGNTLASGMPNKGGNLNLSGTTDAWGPAFNLWIDGTRTLRTEFDLCTP